MPEYKQGRCPRGCGCAEGWQDRRQRSRQPRGSTRGQGILDKVVSWRAGEGRWGKETIVDGDLEEADGGRLEGVCECGGKDWRDDDARRGGHGGDGTAWGIFSARLSSDHDLFCSLPGVPGQCSFLGSILASDEIAVETALARAVQCLRAAQHRP